MSSSYSPIELIARDRDEFANRLFTDALGAFTIFSVFVGDQLGLYRALAQAGDLTSAELAQRTGVNERYAREWLEHQAAICILNVDKPSNGSHARRFSLSPGRAETLTDRDSLSFMAPVAQLIVGSVRPIDALLDVYRSGEGLPFSEYGANMREGQASMNRPMFLKQLGEDWLPAVPDVHARFQTDPPARVADIGCGGGWSCIGIATRYPNVRVDGYDLDEASVELARANVQTAGLSDRVQIYLQDASNPELRGSYDLVVAFECLHDMSNPVGALKTMRGLTADKGAVIIVDERSLEAFQPCAEALEQFFYGFSILHCLPAGMSEQPSAATGTVLRPDTLKKYAAEAGFSRVEILPIDHFFFRFYRLVN